MLWLELVETLSAETVSPGTKSSLVVVAASAAPAVVCVLLDPGFGFFLAPFLLLLTCVCALAAWFLLKLFRLPERARFFLVLGGIALWSVYIGYTEIHSNTAAGRFERLLVEPIPKSVRFLDSEGAIGMAGGHEIIVFAISPADLNAILKAKKFKPHELDSSRDQSYQRRLVAFAKRHQMEPFTAYRVGEEYDFLIMLTNTNRDKALLYRDRL